MDIAIIILLLFALWAGGGFIGSALLSAFFFGSIAEGGSIWIWPACYYAIKAVALCVLQVRHRGDRHPLLY
jgi:hypothetical protein